MMKLPWRKAPNMTESEPNQIEVIDRKIADCLEQIEGAKAEVERTALAAALSDDDALGYEAIGRLNTLQSRHELLLAARKAAEAEAARDQARLNAREFEARRRSLAQRAARLERAVKATSANAKQLIDAFAEQAAAADSVVAVLPAQMRTTADPWHDLLSAEAMKAHTLIEAYRQERAGPTPHLFARPPGTGAVESSADRYSLPTLTQRIGELLANCKARFDQFGPKPSSPPVVSAPPSSGPVSTDEVSPFAAPVDAELPPVDPETDEASRRAAMKREVEAALDEARRDGLDR
jgi:hypothetical protein